MKLVLNDNTIAAKKYSLDIQGYGNLVFTSIGAMSREMDTIERKDKSTVTTGVVNPGTFDVVTVSAESNTKRLMDEWYKLAKDGGASVVGGSGIGYDAGYKRLVTRTNYRGHDGGGADEVVKLYGCFVTKKEVAEGSMDSTDELEITYTISYDDIEFFN